MLKRGDSLLSLKEPSGMQQAIYDERKNTIFAELHVADTGVVTAVGSDSLVTAKPIRDRIVDSSGKVSWQELPEIPDTPFLSVGGAVPT